MVPFLGWLDLTAALLLFPIHVPYGLRGCNALRFVYCFRRYINCYIAPEAINLINCLINLINFLPYVSTSLRIGPLRFQAGGRKRRPLNLALVLCVNFVLMYILLRIHVAFAFVVLDLVFQY